VSAGVSADVSASDARGSLLVAAPLRIEAWALRRGSVPSTRVLRSGMAPRRARNAADLIARDRTARAIAIAGFCGALTADLAPGEIVVATEVRAPDGRSIACDAPELLLEALARRSMPARAGVLLSVDRIVGPRRRATLAAGEALAVDMESAWLAAGARGRPLAVLRAVVDGPGRELTRPLATVRASLAALRALRAGAGALEEWSAAATATLGDVDQPQLADLRE